MKTKYLAILPVLAVAFALTVAPAFAGRSGHNDRHDRRSNEMKIEVENDNEADVKNVIFSKANSGDNNANGNNSTGMIITGMADSFGSAETTANGNETRINTLRYNEIKVDSENEADVKNFVVSGANSGDNNANGNGDDNNSRSSKGRHHHNNNNDEGGLGYIETGEAWSTAQAITVLNTNFTKIN